MLWKARSSTRRVITAVVKKRPRVYLRQKENSYSLLVRCFSTSVMRCRTKDSKNLLKKMTSRREMMVPAKAIFS